MKDLYDDALIEERIATLRKRVETELPEFVKSVNFAVKNNWKGIVISQDAFASDYTDEELILFGMFIKYCGLMGINITIVSTVKSKVAVPC